MLRFTRCIALVLAIALFPITAFSNPEPAKETNKGSISIDAPSLVVPNNQSIAYVRVLNPERLPVRMRDKLIANLSGEVISPYHAIIPGKRDLSIGDQKVEFNFVPKMYYTIFSLPDKSGLAVEKDEEVFFGASDVNDFKANARIRLYDLSNINDYYIRSARLDKKGVYSSGLRYANKQDLQPVTARFIAEPGRKLSLHWLTQKIGDFPDITLQAGSIYTILILGTPKDSVLYLKETPGPYQQSWDWQQKTDW